MKKSAESIRNFTTTERPRSSNNIMIATAFCTVAALAACQDTNTDKASETNSAFNIDRYEETQTGDTDKCIEKYGKDDCPQF